jgi:hypothetical protein
LWTMLRSERTEVVTAEFITAVIKLETVGAMGEENVAGKMALRTGRNVLQSDT